MPIRVIVIDVGIGGIIPHEVIDARAAFESVGAKATIKEIVSRPGNMG